MSDSDKDTSRNKSLDINYDNRRKQFIQQAQEELAKLGIDPTSLGKTDYKKSDAKTNIKQEKVKRSPKTGFKIAFFMVLTIVVTAFLLLQ
jgi:hypothetical protein